LVLYQAVNVGVWGSLVACEMWVSGWNISVFLFVCLSVYVHVCGRCCEQGSEGKVRAGILLLCVAQNRDRSVDASLHQLSFVQAGDH